MSYFNNENPAGPKQQNSQGFTDQPQGQKPNVVVRMSTPPVKPWVTYTIIILTVLVYALQMGTQYLMGADLPAIMGMKVNELIVEGQIWRLITPLLLHGSITHILFNMYALYAFGRLLEQYYGNGRFIMLYLLSGIAGNLASFYLSPNPSLGASTAVFGLVAAEGIFILRNRMLFGKNARSALSNVAFIVIINLFLGLSPGIDNWGHLGGLVGGLAFAWFAGPRLTMSGFFPEFKIVDESDTSKALQIALVELLILVGLAALRIFTLKG